MDQQTNARLHTYVANNRAVLSAYGKNYGRQIFCVKEVFVDPIAKQNMREHVQGNILFIDKPVKHFMIEKIDILAVSIGINANDKPVIILNENIPGVEPIQCSLSKPTFDRKVTGTTVREAIEAQKNNDAPIYFSDLEKLTREVNALNADALRDVTSLISYLENNKKVLSDDTALNNEYLKKYHEECDREESQVVATVQVEVTDED